jgi:hypothetical protein
MTLQCSSNSANAINYRPLPTDNTACIFELFCTLFAVMQLQQQQEQQQEEQGQQQLLLPQQQQRRRRKDGSLQQQHESERSGS